MPTVLASDYRSRVWPGTSGSINRIAALVAAFGAASGRRCPGVSIVCIGSDRSTGDSLGPIVGSLLRGWLGDIEPEASNIAIHGTIEHPIHAGNLASELAEIQQSAGDRLMIGVDACLGRAELVGSVVVARGPLRPGTAVNKQLPPVGDLHVTGTVNVSGFMEYSVLQNTRLATVLELAHEISAGLYQSFAVTARASTPPADSPAAVCGLVRARVIS